jgi:hypothetical protein
MGAKKDERSLAFGFQRLKNIIEKNLSDGSVWISTGAEKTNFYFVTKHKSSSGSFWRSYSKPFELKQRLPRFVFPTFWRRCRRLLGV